MEIFHATKQYFALMGITESLTSQTYPINRKILMSFLVFFFLFISTLTYIIYEANTFLEYVQSIYFCSASIMALVDLVFIVCRVNVLFKSIESLQNVTKTSEFAIEIKNDIKIANILLMTNRKMNLRHFLLLALAFYPEYKELIDKNYRLIQRINKYIYILLMKLITPCAFVPWTCRVYLIYFITDLGNDAFELPIPLRLMSFSKLVHYS